MARNRIGPNLVGRGLTNYVYVDVDGTLLLWPGNPGAPTQQQVENAMKAYRSEPFFDELMPAVNVELVDRLKDWQQRSGGCIVIWSMGGKAHAEMARAFCGLLMATCLAKPDIAIDDGGENFLRKLPVVLPGNFR